MAGAPAPATPPFPHAFGTARRSPAVAAVAQAAVATSSRSKESIVRVKSRVESNSL